MITLVEPCDKYLQSYIEAYDEYKLNDVQTYAFDDARAYNIFEKYDNYRHERNLKLIKNTLALNGFEFGGYRYEHSGFRLSWG